MIERTANDGNIILSGIPPIPEEVSSRLKPYHDARYATFADFTRDGTGIYVSTRFANTAQLHRVDEPGGMRRQLTYSPEPIRDAVRRPRDEELLFAMDVGGGEFYQFYVLDPRSGRQRMVTDGHSRNIAPRWSPDGSRLALTSTRRDGHSNDIWILDPDEPDGARLMLEAPDAASWVAVDWHPTRDQLLIEQYRSITDARIHLLDLVSGELTPLTADAGEGAYFPVGFDPGGSGIFLATDGAGEFNQLAYLPLDSGEIEILTGEIPWNVEAATLDPGHARLAFTTNENGTSRLHVMDASTHRFRSVDEAPTGVIQGLRFSDDGHRLGFTVDRGISPADAHTLDLGDGPFDFGAVDRWTFSEVGGLDPNEFTAPRPITFLSFDGLEIPAFAYMPPGEGPHPVIINIHGGPEGQSRPLFSGTFQSWTRELNAALIDPNVRGSAGYGKNYLKLDNGVLREDSVRDIGALLDWIAQNPALDEKRVAVHGGSYGGYMVLASLMHHGDRLRGGVDLVGISDFITFLENTQEYRRELRRAEYGDERDPEMRAFFERISPLRNADRIAAPLFVIQGQNDPRVPVTEAEQIVAQVREAGRPVWYMNALNEGHGYARRENQDLMRDAVFLFLRTCLSADHSHSLAG